MPINTCFPTSVSTCWADNHIAISGIMGVDKNKPYSLCGEMGNRFWIEEWGYPAIGVAICTTPSAGHDMIFLDYRNISVVSYSGSERKEVVVPKYAVLTTHCGRRTFIVNALRLGIPASVIMEWTGHSDYKAMKPYIKIVDAAKVENMARFDNFGKTDKDG